MSAATLTTAHAQTLYERGLAFVPDTLHLTTRTALYDWNTTAQCYERTQDGLRVVHSIGATWNGTRFVRCACAYCTRYAALAAQVDIAP